jgi:hypothetical protein
MQAITMGDTGEHKYRGVCAFQTSRCSFPGHTTFLHHHRYLACRLVVTCTVNASYILSVALAATTATTTYLPKSNIGLYPARPPSTLLLLSTTKLKQASTLSKWYLSAPFLAQLLSPRGPLGSLPPRPFLRPPCAAPPCRLDLPRARQPRNWPWGSAPLLLLHCAC